MTSPADLFASYSIQSWLDSTAQGSLVGTEYGHAPGLREPEALLLDDRAREKAIRTTVQLVIGERCALAATSGLINLTPDEGSKRFLATQTLDEARHVEVFTKRLFDLGVLPSELTATLRDLANPGLLRFAELLLEQVHKGDFVAAVVGQNVLLEGLFLTVFDLLRTRSLSSNPKFASTLAGIIADERRHVGFGENTVGALLRRHPERRPALQRLQRDLSSFVLAACAGDLGAEETPQVEDGATLWRGADLSSLEPAQIETLLATRVLEEFKERLARVGLDYQTPASAPVGGNADA